MRATPLAGCVTVIVLGGCAHAAAPRSQPSLLELRQSTAPVLAADAVAPPAPGPAEPKASHPLAGSPHLALGVPTDADPSDDHPMDKGAYVLSYGERMRAAHWVAWRLDASDLGSAPRRERFRGDDDLPLTFTKLTARAYSGTGYDRGHLCPSAHRTSSSEVNALTFLMTNMHPQRHALNAGPWKGIESYERERAREGQVLHIVAGALFDDTPEMIAGSIPIPVASFRVTVVLQPGQGPDDVDEDTTVIGAIMPNDEEVRGRSWEEFAVSVDAVEERSGYDLLAALPDEVEVVVEAQIGSE